MRITDLIKCQVCYEKFEKIEEYKGSKNSGRYRPRCRCVRTSFEISVG